MNIGILFIPFENGINCALDRKANNAFVRTAIIMITIVVAICDFSTKKHSLYCPNPSKGGWFDYWSADFI